jgi:hypothetical protein
MDREYDVRFVDSRNYRTQGLSRSVTIEEVNKMTTKFYSESLAHDPRLPKITDFPAGKDKSEQSGYLLEFERICRYASWRLLKDHMLFVLYACSIFEMDILPRKMRMFNRFIVVDQILKFIEAQSYYIPENFVRRLVGKLPRMGYYTIPHVLKFIDFNIKNMDFLIKMLRPTNFKLYKYELRSHYVRGDVQPLLQSHSDFQEEIKTSRNTSEIYRKLLARLITGTTIYSNEKSNVKIREFVVRAESSSFYRRRILSPVL